MYVQLKLRTNNFVVFRKDECTCANDPGKKPLSYDIVIIIIIITGSCDKMWKQLSVSWILVHFFEICEKTPVLGFRPFACVWATKQTMD